MLDVASFAQIAATLPYAFAAAVMFGVGAGILFYERFSPASARFFVLAALISAWFMGLVTALLATDPVVARYTWQIIFALQALTAPALYGVALHLTGSPRGRLGRPIWLAGMAWAALSVLTPAVNRGVGMVARGQVATVTGLVGVLFILFVVAVVAGAAYEWLAALRRADTVMERRRHQAMLGAVAVGALSVVDYFFVDPVLGPVGLSSLTVTLAVVIIAIAQIRYRSFGPATGFPAGGVVRAMSDAVLVCDGEGVVRIANPAACKLLGASADELVGRPVAALLSEGRWATGDALTRSGSAPFQLSPCRDRRMALLPDDGSPIPVRVSVETLPVPGAPGGWVVVARDVRERMAAKRALEAAQRRYRSLFRHSPAVTYEITPQGTILALNPSAERLLGVRPGELKGRPFADVMAPEALDEAGAILRGALAGEAREYELDVVAGSGERRTLRGVSLPVMDGGRVIEVFGVALDVTEETRAKRELEVQRRYFAELFEASPEGIVLLDESGTVVDVNGEFSRLFGYSRQEAQGRQLEGLIVPDGLREEAVELDTVVARGETARAETARRRKDGGLVDVSVLARQVRISGEALRTYAIYRDISSRKATERKLREREEELRHAQRLESVGKLAGGVAHDFNNLLTVINGHARLVLDTLEESHPAQGDLEEIERAGVRAASLTQQLLAFSRRQVLHPEVLDLNGVVADLERMLRRLIGSHIVLETRLASGGARVLADRGQIDQVIMNLAVNARDAMPDGGTLIIQTEPALLEAGDPEPAAWGVEPGAYVRLTVADSGVGMTEDVLARAFDPFFTTKDRGKGTGLGLATVFGIVKQSGGHVTAQSAPGEGARVCVYLPTTSAGVGDAPELADAAPAPAHAAPPEADEPSAPGHTVLVVEDEEPVRKLAVRVLERQGYRVLSAGNGVEALQQVASYSGRIDVLVTDLVMPEMGGRELAARMRELRPDTAVLIMSGYDEEMVAGGLAGAEFIPKPFTPAALVECVAALANGTRD